MSKSTINDQPLTIANLELSQLRVAIVQDWLVGGGAEKVVLEIHKMFPDAPIYTSYSTNEWREKLDNKVVTGWLQHFGKFRKFMVLPRIWWFQHLDLSNFDLIISSSGNGEAFAVRKNYIPLKKRLANLLNGKWKMENEPTQSVHINYCHTPTHYYWRHYNTYIGRPGFGVFDPLARLGLRLLVGPLRKWDYKAAQRADVMIANSTHIQTDIKKYYDRDSTVIFPPVNTEQISATTSDKRHGFIASGRLAAAKHVDVIVDAATKLSLPLKVVGKGPAYADLVKRAGPTVQMLGFISDPDLYNAWASSEAYIFASHDDFGMSPVEAMAAGTPVIAYKAGGALDYVIPGISGEFFSEQTVESLTEVLKSFDSSKYNSDDIKKASERFSIKAFHKSMHELLQSVLK